MNPYIIPEPSEDPIASLVMHYKVTKKIEYDDRSWDKQHWGRSALRAKELLEVCGIYEVARRCIDELSDKFNSSGHSWTFETIVKHCHDWKQSKEKNNDQQKRTRFLNALSVQRSSYATSGKGTSVTAGEILDSVGTLKAIQSKIRTENGSSDPNDGAAGE